MTTHAVGQQRASVSQQGSSAETKPAVRRIENCDDELEDHGNRWR